MWVLVLASAASLMAALDAMVVSTALTTIRVDLGASIEQLEWTVNAYNLTLAVLLLPAAALGDRFGRRRLFTAGLGLFVAASAACALAPDAGSLIAARAVQGAARIEESFGGDTALDVGGFALVAGGALGVVWGLVRGNSAGWGSAEVVAALAVGAALLTAFVAWELRAREPMLPMRFFRSRAFSSGNAGVFFLFASLFGAVFFLAQFLQTGLGHGPLGAGLLLAPWTGTLFVVAPIAGALVDRIGERPLLVGGLVLQAVGMAWIALIAEPGLAYGELIGPLVVAGIGASMAIPPAASSVVGAVAQEEVGKAAGANSMLRELGGVFGIAILVAVFAGAGSYASAGAFSDGFARAIAVSAALSLVGAIAGLGMPGRPQATEAASRPEPVAAFETEGRG